MIEHEITSRMRDWAKRKMRPDDSQEHRPLHKYGSEPGRILEGYVGQTVVMKHWQIVGPREQYDYDLIYQGLKYDVKTISCEYRPPPNFLAVVNSSDEFGHRKQACDRYVFARIQFDHTVGWICGWMDNDLFWQAAVRVKKGETYEGIMFDKAPAAVMHIRDLAPMEDIFEVPIVIIGPTCNTCKHYVWKKLDKWCRAWDAEIGDLWEVGCDQYKDAYIKELPV